MRVYIAKHTMLVKHWDLIDISDIWSKTLVVFAKYFQIKKWIAHDFGSGAYTQALILAESHVIIQTYPELNKVFVTLEYHEEDGKKKIAIYDCLWELNNIFQTLEYKSSVEER